jgi:hypothetical protein
MNLRNLKEIQFKLVVFKMLLQYLSLLLMSSLIKHLDALCRMNMIKILKLVIVLLHTMVPI